VLECKKQTFIFKTVNEHVFDKVPSFVFFSNILCPVCIQHNHVFCTFPF